MSSGAVEEELEDSIVFIVTSQRALDKRNSFHLVKI